MLILPEETIQTNYLMKDAISDLKEGFLSKINGSIQNPHRTVIEFPEKEASALYMPSADKEQEMASVKVVSIFPGNPIKGQPTTQGVLMLTDASTGEHLCMMNASYLTRLRTGALSGIATDKLSRLNSSVLGVVGTGAMAFEQVLGVLEVRKIKTIRLFNKTEHKALDFKQKLKGYGLNQEINICHNVKDVVTSADIICCSTRSNTPVFNGDLLNKGTHINGVGSYLASMCEVDLKTILKSSKIVVDDLPAVKEEAGELISANESGEWSFSNLYAELSDISNNDCLSRETEEEITFFKSVGAAYIDLLVAKGIYFKAKKIGIGEYINI